MRTFKKYKSYIALDPYEWPGEWVNIIKGFPKLFECRIECREEQKTVDSIPIESNVKFDFINFFIKICGLNISAPKGGIIFLDDKKNIFKTNWELAECWEWNRILERVDTQNYYMHYFSATGAKFEIKHENDRIQLQHLDHEHPDGLEGSRSDLSGVVLENKNAFIAEVRSTLYFLNEIKMLSDERGKISINYGSIRPNGKIRVWIICHIEVLGQKWRKFIRNPKLAVESNPTNQGYDRCVQFGL